VWNDVPLGYPKATNNGIKEATCDKIILLNNDTRLLNQPKNFWLETLEKPFQNPDCGISCVVKEFTPVTCRHYAIFFCVMIDRKVFDKIGLLNEKYGIGSCEDIEFSMKVEDAGFEIYEITDKSLTTEFYTGAFPIYHVAEGTMLDKNLVSLWDVTFTKNKLSLAYEKNFYWKLSKQTNDKKIAVLTTITDRIEDLFQTVDSVKRQNVDNVIHYIYIDEKFGGKELIKSMFPRDHSVVLITGKNNSPSEAKNILIKEALFGFCDYICFLDSNRFWSSIFLQTLLTQKEHANIIYSTNPNPQVISPNVFLGRQLYHNNFIDSSSVLIQRECFKNHRFDESLDSDEFWDLCIRLHESNYTFYSCQENVSFLVLPEENIPSEKFKNKYKLLNQLKLHLACGYDYNEEYINIDLYSPEDAKCDARFDVKKLPYPDNSVDEIKAFHIIEHFDFLEIKNILDEWYRVLKPNGRLYLETPDLLETCRSFVEGSPTCDIEQWRIRLYGHMFAQPWVPGQTHKFLFTETQLRTNLSWSGFKFVRRLPPASNYVMPETAHLFLTVEAFK
jgi:predicted SAM-dependent methyltransferase